MERTAAWHQGYESMAARIRADGFAAARDAFNADWPPGKSATGSPEVLQRADGEYAALYDAIQKQR